jgi:hypothetical protein
MATFDSTKTALSKLLQDVVDGKIQLPDFQRGWVWDDAHIRSLLVSIARSFPIGAVMLLETGGDVHFQIRPIEGVDIPVIAKDCADLLILDGQQRLTSLTQVLKLPGTVKTRDDKGREVERFYYIDIKLALSGNIGLEDAIIGLDADKIQRKNFGRDVVLDLSSQEKEFTEFYFPCSQILNSDEWEEGLMAYDATKFAEYMQFRKLILGVFRDYQLPVIELKKETSKEAVCLVFEKVNTGGVPLSVFELVTATYAAEGFNLRDDWFGKPPAHKDGRLRSMAIQPLLRDLEPTDFLQGISLLHTYEQRQVDIDEGKSGKEVRAVSAKREHVLAIPLQAYEHWADKLVAGFLTADKFLRMEGFAQPKFLPYRSQLVPLSAVMVHLGERWLEPVIYNKIARWFWCGVLGELYGSAVETRIALDLQGMLEWINKTSAPEPTTVAGAGFYPSRLDTLRTRTSAAYRGIYVLLQREGAQDFFWKAKIKDLDSNELSIDIHHIFPRAWCESQKIPGRLYNSIVNKTPISYKANRMIGGKSPSLYLKQLQGHSQVQLSEAEMDDILSSHLVTASLLRADDFTGFYEARKNAILSVIEKAMGKAVIVGGDEVVDDSDDNIDE